MMDFPKGTQRQSWQSRVAAPPQMTDQPVMDFQPIDFQGGSTTTDASQDGGDWMSDESNAFALPAALEGDFGVGGGGTVDFSQFNPEEFTSIYNKIGTEDAVKQMLEGQSVGGTLDSSIAVQKTADEVARAKEEWLARAMGMWQSAQEAGKSRGLSAGIASQGNALQKAMFEARLPMEIAASMASLGGAAQNAEMQPWEIAYNDWQRSTPEASMGTYGNALLGLLGQEPGGPPQYEEGWATKIAGMGGGLLPSLLGGLFDKGNTASLPPGRNFSNLPFLEPQDQYYPG